MVWSRPCGARQLLRHRAPTDPRNPLDEIVHVTVGVFAGYQMPEWSGTPEDFPGVISLQGTCLVAHLFHGAPDSRSQQG